ncbi:hypothetical protein SK128_011852, partial [Halocaridina rubra]
GAGEDQDVPLKCHSCPKEFIGSNKLETLTNHLMLHSEKPYACPFCSHRSNRKDNLQYHIQTHGSRKPFRCPYCPHRANRKGNLKNHITSRHAKELQSLSVSINSVIITETEDS